MEPEGPGPILRAGILVAACVLILSAPLAGLFGLKELLKEAGPLSWPETTGKVTRSLIQASRDPEQPKFRLEVAYDYEVDGKQYSSEGVYLEDRTFNSVKDAIQAKEPYSVSSTPTIYYDPDDPENTILERGTRTKSWIWLFSPLVLGGVGGLFLWGWLVLRKELRKKKIPSEFDI